ncbi:MAG TPA: ABC transporter permease [Ktedonobacteraceae bacterium]|nr:ABC transporter permease [Ktedonobacteraceae bacterium]
MSVISNESNETVNALESQVVPSVAAARRRRSITINMLRILLLIIIVGGWELAAQVGIIDPFFWGRPSGIWQQIVTWMTQGTAQGPLWEQVAVTLEEAIIGFLIGSVLGIIFGVVLGRNRFLADILGPYVKVGNSIPRVTLAPLFAIGLGLGMESKIALAVVLVFFIVFFNAFQGVREVDRNLLANARILGASQQRITTAVIIPSAMTWIFASLHTSFSFALVGAVVGEYVGSIQGIGLLIQNAGNNFNANGVFAAMVILAVVALLSEFLITLLEHRLLKWRPNPVADVTI